MSQETKKFLCINCGNKVDNLYKKYSPTVLKLTDCDICLKTADKYVEYDIVILIIDLILLQQAAYRHVLFNTEYKNFWKLSIILLFMETYSEWSHLVPVSKQHFALNKLDDIDRAGIEFYKISLLVAIRSICFLFFMYCHTFIYDYLVNNSVPLTFITLWRTVTVSSFGIFLQLPVIIWDVGVQNFHKIFITLYTVLSQLVAYRALCNCSKFWSIFVILFSYLYQNLVLDYMMSHVLINSSFHNLVGIFQ